MHLSDILKRVSKRSTTSYIDFLDTVPNKLKSLPSLEEVWDINKSKTYNQMLRSGGKMTTKKVVKKTNPVAPEESQKDVNNEGEISTELA